MNKNTTIIAVVIIIVIGAFFYFQKNKAPAELTGEPIRIGHVSPLTGDAATYGEPMRNAAQMAVDEINNSGGVNGRMLEVIYEDSKCTGKDAFSATQKLISLDGVRIITGFTCAEDLLSSAPLIEENKVITLAPGASGPNVTFAGDYIFQVNPSATIAAEELSSLILSKGHKRVAVISENTSFAVDNRDHFVKQIESGQAIVVSSETYNPNVRDFKTILLKIKEANPDALFVNPQTEISGGTIIKQAREIGIEVPMFGMDTVTGEKTLELAGSSAEGLTAVAVPGLDSNNQKAQNFLKTYAEKFGAPIFDLYLGAAYDSIYLIAEAVGEVGDDPTRMKEYLYDLKNREGVIGNYGFDENGDLEGIKFTVKQVVNGKYETIE